MQRASFTVKSRNRLYDANHLSVTLGVSDGEQTSCPGAISMLTFECSGQTVSLPVTQVDDVVFKRTGTGWCPYCDQSLHCIIGEGIHNNPDSPDKGKPCS
jgi:hypothetical protein